MAEPQGYEGTIAAVRCGIGGLSSNLNPSAISLKNVTQAEGAVFRQDHWRKEPGTVLFGTNTTPATGTDLAIVAINDWHPTESVQRIVTLRGDGHLYFTDANPGTSGNPGAHQSSTTSGSGTTFGYFVTGGNEPSDPTNRKLFLFRKNKLPTVVIGDVTNDTVITKPAADWSNAHPPIVGLINGGSGTTNSSGSGGRLCAAGNTNNPHALYVSQASDQQDFTTVGGFTTDFQTLSIFPGVGQRIMGLRNYQGFTVVFKYPRGVFLIDMRDADPANWLTQQVTDQIGIAPSPYTTLQLENDVIFLGSDGQFYLLSAVISAASGQNNMQTANLGMDLDIYQFLLSAYQRDQLGTVTSVYQPFWQTAQFAVTSPGGTGNDSRLYFDFNAVGRKQGSPRFAYSYRDKCASMCLWRDPTDFIEKPIYGDYQSNVILMEQDARTAWDGAAYPFRIQTPFTNMGEFENLDYGTAGKFVQFSNRNKLWDFLEIEYLPFTDARITITAFVDGRIRGPSITPSLCDGGKPLGFSDTDSAAFVIGDSLLAGGVVLSRPLSLRVGSGRRISILFENANAGEDVAITHIYFYFRVSDTTGPRFC